jgi:hypothetical protein
MRLDYGFVAYLPSSSTPTQEHDSSNHSNGYGCLKYSARAELADCWKTTSMVRNPKTVLKLDEDYNF